MDKRGGNDKQIIFWGKTMISNIQVSPVKKMQLKLCRSQTLGFTSDFLKSFYVFFFLSAC